jgi:hypothetical protein
MWTGVSFRKSVDKMWMKQYYNTKRVEMAEMAEGSFEIRLLRSHYATSLQGN